MERLLHATVPTTSATVCIGLPSAAAVSNASVLLSDAPWFHARPAQLVRSFPTLETPRKFIHVE